MKIEYQNLKEVWKGLLDREAARLDEALRPALDEAFETAFQAVIPHISPKTLLGLKTNVAMFAFNEAIKGANVNIRRALSRSYKELNHHILNQQYEEKLARQAAREKPKVKEEPPEKTKAKEKAAPPVTTALPVIQEAPVVAPPDFLRDQWVVAAITARSEDGERILPDDPDVNLLKSLSGTALAALIQNERAAHREEPLNVLLSTAFRACHDRLGAKGLEKCRRHVLALLSAYRDTPALQGPFVSP